MEFKFFCPRWGHENLPKKYFVRKAKDSGYDGIEMPVSTDEREKDEWSNLFSEYELLFIGQMVEAGQGQSFDVHLKETGFYIKNLVSLNPLKINTFTGRDYFSFEQNCKLISFTTDLEKEIGIPIVHETHRGRFTYSAPAIQHYFDDFPEMRINADFSHWCCVSESYLQEKELSDITQKAIHRSDHIHARIGHPEAPQVNDPRAPEWRDALNYHLQWWDQIADIHTRKNTEIFTITPEFGPVPYCPALPYTQQPLADQWEINVWMMELLKKRYIK